MKFMFCFCSSLSYISDISKWNTKNVIDITGIFMGCSSLSFLPDINKWNKTNMINANHLFEDSINLLNYNSDFNDINIDLANHFMNEINVANLNYIYNFEDSNESDESDSI